MVNLLMAICMLGSLVLVCIVLIISAGERERLLDRLMAKSLSEYKGFQTSPPEAAVEPEKADEFALDAEARRAATEEFGVAQAESDRGYQRFVGPTVTLD